jgi:thioredoxin-like negative regulator of GroEL
MQRPIKITLPSSSSSVVPATPAAAPAIRPAAIRIRGIVFSKDRPLQLEATLASYRRRCLDAESIEVCVLYTCSNDAHRAAYETLACEYPLVKFVREADFRRDVLTLLQGCQAVMFLVDDTIFVQPFALAQVRAALAQHPDAIGFSLRLGRNTTYCYSMDGAQALPAFEEIGPEILKFDWRRAELDFGYPLEVSSSVYRAGDIEPLLAALPFHHPNSLEEQIAHATEVFNSARPALLCFRQSVAFSAPLNRVQSTNPNRAGNDPRLAPAALLDTFAAGDRIDVEAFAGFVPTACHQEVDLKLVDYGPCLATVEGLLGEGKLDDAVWLIETFLERAVQHPAASHDLAALYLAQDRTVDARQLLEAVVATHPDAALPRRALAERRFYDGDRDGALRALQPLLAPSIDDREARDLAEKISAWVPHPITRHLIVTVAP